MGEPIFVLDLERPVLHCHRQPPTFFRPWPSSSYTAYPGPHPLPPVRRLYHVYSRASENHLTPIGASIYIKMKNKTGMSARSSSPKMKMWDQQELPPLLPGQRKHKSDFGQTNPIFLKFKKPRHFYPL